MFKKENKVASSQVYVFLICLLISVSIWVSIKLSHEHVSHDNIIVDVVNETGLIIVEKPDSVIRAEITSGGFDLLIHKLFEGTSYISLDIGEGMVSESSGSRRITFSEFQIRRLIDAEIDKAYKLVSFTPDVLSFTVATPDTLTMRVEPSLSLKFAPQYMQYGDIVVNPEMVSIFGPKKILRNITKLTTETVEFDNLSKDMRMVTRLITLPEYTSLTFSQKEVVIDLDVEKFTEASITLSVSTDSIETEKSIRLYAGEVELRYLAAFKDYHNISPELFLLIPDTSGMYDEGRQKLNLKLERSPDYIQIIDIKPSSVEFIFLE